MRRTTSGGSPSGFAKPVERVLECGEERRELLDVKLAKRVRERALEGHPVLERVARTGRPARPVREDPPLAVTSTREIGGVDVHPRLVGNVDAVDRP